MLKPAKLKVCKTYGKKPDEGKDPCRRKDIRLPRQAGKHDKNAYEKTKARDYAHNLLCNADAIIPVIVSPRFSQVFEETKFLRSPGSAVERISFFITL